MKNIELIEKRKSKGLTQVQVAKQAGVTEACYQSYEAGKRLPRVDVAIRIARALESSVEELFGEGATDGGIPRPAASE